MGKRGPKRKQTKREANGRASRTQEEIARRAALARDGLDREQQETISVALEARQRVFGIPAPLSRDQMAGSAVGRFCLTGRITRVQYDAAMLYLEDCDANSRALATPGIPRAIDLNAIGGQNNHENVAKARAAMARHAGMVKAVREKQIEVGNRGNLFGALDAVIRQNVELDHLLGDLRLALNALARHYGVDGRAAA